MPMTWLPSSKLRTNGWAIPDITPRPRMVASPSPGPSFLLKRAFRYDPPSRYTVCPFFTSVCHHGSLPIFERSCTPGVKYTVECASSASCVTRSPARTTSVPAASRSGTSSSGGCASMTSRFLYPSESDAFSLVPWYDSRFFSSAYSHLQDRAGTCPRPFSTKTRHASS
ncbi:MAG: hypothetical protein ACYTFI_05625 [Planctomycetota bacterium]